MSFVRISKRSIHTVPKLPLFKQWSNDGIKGFMSKEQFDISWNKYQDYLTKKLSLNTVGTEFESKTPFEIVISTKNKSNLNQVYHFASQSHNNHLFFQQLKDNTATKSSEEILDNNEVNEIRPILLKQIEKNFGSFQNFKNEFNLKADNLNGQGWIFLVENSDKSLEIKSINNDGTPYHFGRNQSLDLNGSISTNDYLTLIENKTNTINKVKDFTLPLLALNCWEYAYLNDYGINGKADYINNFWKAIDWNVINNRVFLTF
ncbi:unnamed protein product [[Candida] boidinii]|nr:hypothetical protein BVG19_g3648 [[Candida] boidinii]OWB52412.1 hypothetical protein B5S27_g3987 [[Candida] boidinii]OWB85101.1 hypothetical protein B5S33_g3759 [[Candida] boidinii]GME98994.1 unnamed protein product [[Candida] boidinii]